MPVRQAEASRNVERAMTNERSDVRHLLDVMSAMTIVDTHEHLPSEAERLKMSVDFSLMFSHYCQADLMTAGMSLAQFERFRHPEAPTDEKWQLFAPFYERIQDGAYCRAAHIAMQKFYDAPPLANAADAEALTRKMREANRAGLYDRVLKDACGIAVGLNFGQSPDPHFQRVMNMGSLVQPSYATLLDLEAQTGVACTSLERYLEAVRVRLGQMKRDGMVGLKFQQAYLRDLRFPARTTAEAEAVFLRLIQESYGWRTVGLGFEESRPLQDFLVHRFLEMAAERDVPAVFHTGLQHKVHHNLSDADPLLLWYLPFTHRTTRFVLLHGGVPWTSQAGMLAKHYPNVWLDMAWLHVISPVLAERTLAEWIDYVPRNKIFGFGGDYKVVEKVYGHLILARENIARALAAKMEQGMSASRAEGWLQAILRDNPAEVYKLELR